MTEPTRTSPIRVLLVDDHWVVRDGIALVLSREPDISVTDAVGSGEEAVSAFLRTRPDVVLMDLQLGGMSGIDAIREIRKHDQRVPIIVLSMFSGEEDIRRALASGATAYLLKGSPPKDLVRSVRDVHSGAGVTSGGHQADLSDRPALTERETDVLRLIFKGYRNKGISDALSISEATVEAHLRNIFKKLDVHDRTAAVYIALRRGIIHVD